MKQEIILSILIIYFILQILLSGPVIVFIINAFFKKYLVIKTRSTGFILPFFLFYANGFELKTSGYNKTDIIKIRVEKIFFWISPFLLLLGQIRIYNLNLLEPEMKYVNRVFSNQKIKYMPKMGRVKMNSANVTNGTIDIEDRTVFPNYKVLIQNIGLVNSNIDLGIPLRLLFDSEYGYCRIDAGDVVTKFKNGKGNLKVQGVTWGKLINMELLPIGFLKNKIDLDISFFHERRETFFEGVISQVDRDPIREDRIDKKKKLKYKFQIDWLEYQLPFDLGLRKIIYKLLSGLNYGGVINLTVNTIAESISKFLKK